jgi:hypothetical protein
MDINTGSRGAFVPEIKPVQKIRDKSPPSLVPVPYKSVLKCPPRGPGPVQKAGAPFSPGWWLQPGLKGSDIIFGRIIEKKPKFFSDFFKFPYF